MNMMDSPFDQLSPPLSSSHDEAASFFQGLDEQVLRGFYEPLETPNSNQQQSDPDRCHVCLGLDRTTYRNLPEFEHRICLYQLRGSATRQGGCITCLVVFNALVVTNLRYDLIKWDQKKLRLAPLELVTITLEPGFVPRITWSAEYGFDLLSRSENGPLCCPPLDSFAGSQSIPDIPTLDHVLSIVKPLLQECDTLHSSLCRPAAKILPKRLVDIGNGVKLVNTEDVKSKERKWIALSHCWGESRPIETKTVNLDQHHQAIAWDKLSKTFQDAIQISRGLGIRYIWIDSLCIVQDDPVDWEIEAAKMASVYSGSHLTIAATGSKNGHGGCLFARPTFESELTEVYADQKAGCKIYVRGYRYIMSHGHFTGNTRGLYDAPLLSRAWCFQERLLSPRILHFHGQEIVWECGAASSCECGFLRRAERFGNRNFQSSRQQITRAFDNDANTTETDRDDSWFKVIEQYSVLEITRESDRFPALAGLASRFADSFSQRPRPDRYLAGLWENNLWQGLAWMPHQKPHRRSEGVPSWSWASMEFFERPVDFAAPQYRDHRGTYYWQDRFGFRHVVPDENLRLLSANGLQTDEALSFMRGNGITLKVRGICAMADPRAPDGYSHFDKPFLIAWDVEGENDGVTEVLCLLLGAIPKSGREYDDIGGHSRFLVLEQLSQPGMYRRIGIGETLPERPRGMELFDGAECKVIELV